MLLILLVLIISSTGIFLVNTNLYLAVSLMTGFISIIVCMVINLIYIIQKQKSLNEFIITGILSLIIFTIISIAYGNSLYEIIYILPYGVTNTVLCIIWYLKEKKRINTLKKTTPNKA